MQRLLEKIIIPPELKSNDSIKLVHLTDTPSQIYKEIKRLLESIHPDYVIHTGDICDDIKLGHSPKKIDLYDKKIAHLAQLMEGFKDTKFYFVMGNHDDYSTLKKYFPEAFIFDRPTLIENEFGLFCVAHEFKDIKDIKADYYLFGHDMTQKTIVLEGQLLLNGLEHIYVLKGNPVQIITIEYPYSTDAIRQKKSFKSF
ncbi:MAG: metallophosphoesterase [Clostridia bacterium]|nr:metallophosphoesterase [Clostridia bacterium]